MKKRSAILSFVLLLLCAAFIGWFCIYRVDDEEYLKIFERAKAQTQDNAMPHHASQEKMKLSKQFWRMSGGQRLFFRLDAQEGRMLYEKEYMTSRLIEEMRGVKGVFQKSVEVLSDERKKQEVYVFQAEKVRYDHQKDFFTAQELIVHLYRIEGDLVPEDLDSDRAYMILAAKKGVFEGAEIAFEGEVLLEIPKKQTKIFAEKVLIQDFPKNMILNGDVRLTRREGKLLQYLLADDAIYDLLQENIHFYARGSNRVLLHDKVNNLEVTAPEIVMYRDEAKKLQFKGIGDVKFRFAEEEYERMQKRFLLERDSVHAM